MDVKLIRAFIASPGGLKPEREAAHAVARQVSRAVASELGGRLELIGWEDTLSGSGRPQAIINADMESCDLFIGVIWTRWGTQPSLDGPYTSGFQEEFELSRARHGRNGSPTMAMFFKDIDQLQLEDPGDELKKVLAFREKLQNEKAFLYDTFETPEQFAEKVRDFLTTHTIRLLSQSPRGRGDKVQTEPTVKVGEGEASRETSPNGALSEVIEARFLTAAAQALGGEREPSSSEVARLRLIAIVSGKADNDKMVLGAHDANLLYQERKGLELSFAEKRGLANAGLVELAHENVPLWTWLADVIRRRASHFTALTIFGEDASRAGALTAMLLLGERIQPPDFLKVDLVAHYWLGEHTGLPVKTAALRYLRELGEPAHLPAIEAEIERSAKETLALGQEAALAINLRADPANAARYLLSLSFETLDQPLLIEVLELLNELGTDALAKGLDHRSALVRQRTIELLSARGALDLEIIGRARDDDSAPVRLAAIDALEALGQPLSIDEAYKILNKPRPPRGLFGFYRATPDNASIKLFEGYRASRFTRMSVSSVEALLGSADHRDAAYLALAARRVDDFPVNLREDLRDGFQRYAAQHWPEGIRPSYGGAASLLSLGTTDPLEAKRHALTRDALDLIARQRDEADLPLVRHVLATDLVGPTPATVAYLRALGDRGDIALLGKASRSLHWWEPLLDRESAFQDAARAILHLHTGSVEDLVGLALPPAMRTELITQMPGADFAKLSDAAILTLLLSEIDELRRASAIKVPASLSRARARKLLFAYWQHEDGRYYVVPHWLDLGLAFTRAQARRVATMKTTH